MSVTEIVEGLDINSGATRVALKRLKDKGKVVKVGEKWGLSVNM
jgi:predicted transcriptional regulator